MWSVLGIVAGTAAIAVMEIRLLLDRSRKDEKVRNVITFGVLLALGSGLYAAVTLHAPLPNPLQWIEAAFHLIGW